ncbi:MAG: hydrogenase maturation protease [Acidobacteriota bacterium]|jgi:hydrogenase maturation protease
MEAQSTSKRTLIIGLGNPLISADAFGPRVIECLRREDSGSVRSADLIDAHTDLLGQIESFPAYARVVLVDAILDPGARVGNPGEVVLVDEDTLVAWPEASTGIHQLSPVLAVKLFRSLHPHVATQILLVGLCTDGSVLGPATGAEPGAFGEQAVAQGAERIRELL